MQLWQNFSARAKTGLIIGSLLILSLAAGLAWWAYRTDYAVLFADLSTGDASAMVAELERSKTPYQLTDGGRTIMVPKDLVYKTRLKVMGKELPLHGAVGFEVFNNADFGMTEFVQKVNYQRAVQGELTRTIMAIDDVQAARVHLAIPEQGLFKKALSKPKASVTLTLKKGRVLGEEQIGGIQRLIAASVPEIVANDVTIIDQHGVPLTRVANHDGSIESAHTQLDSKRQVENYLLKKVTPILDNMFGSGAAMASVDVVLNLDQDKITTEEVLPAKTTHNEGVPTGVVVRERQTTSGSVAAAGNATNAANSASTAAREPTAGNSSVESDYQTGRRVAQTVVAPGGTKRMTVAVVVKASLTPAQIEHVKEVVGLALGINSQRGDAIVVQTMDALITRANAGVALAPDNKLANLPDAVSDAKMNPAANAANATNASGNANASMPSNLSLLWVLAVLATLLLVALLFAARAARERAAQAQAASMSVAERERLLQELKQWMTQEGAAMEARK